MTIYARKYSPIFFAPGDELHFEKELQKSRRDVWFVDGCLWSSATPPVKHSLAECTSLIVYIWDRDACPEVPYELLSDGRARGPTSGVVIQLIRCVLREQLLSSGDIGIGYEKRDMAIAEFVKAVFAVAKSMNCCTLSSVDATTGEVMERGIVDYIVGKGSKNLSEKGTLLKHMAAEVYYRSE